MDEFLAESLSRSLNIAVEQVVREEAEMFILKVFFESKQGRYLVFKGGTALRTAYGSPRFSDDLDFSAVSPIPAEDFEDISRTAVKGFAGAELVEALAKRFTLFALYRVRVPFVGRPFSIKVEISTRPVTMKPERDFELKLLTSEVTNLNVLAQVETLERLWKDKKTALASRRQPRDLFDMWFISQKLGKGFSPDLAGFDRKIVVRELRKYLPRTHWGVIDQWTG